VCGHPEYDLKAPAIFIAQSDKAVWREFLLGYGYRPEEVPDLSRRLMAYALLHRFARLPHYFELMPAPDARTLDDLADAWFGI
jgi:hygromycin-B 7''-O-kinase